MNNIIEESGVSVPSLTFELPGGARGMTYGKESTTLFLTGMLKENYYSYRESKINDLELGAMNGIKITLTYESMVHTIVENVATIVLTGGEGPIAKSMLSTFDAIIDCIPELITMVHSIEPYIQDKLKTKKSFTRPSQFNAVIKNFVQDIHILSHHYQGIQDIVVSHTNKLLDGRGSPSQNKEVKSALNTIIASLAVEINTRMQKISLIRDTNLDFANTYLNKKERKNIEEYQQEDILTTLACQTEEEIIFRQTSLPLFEKRVEEIGLVYGFTNIKTGGKWKERSKSSIFRKSLQNRNFQLRVDKKGRYISLEEVVGLPTSIIPGYAETQDTMEQRKSIEQWRLENPDARFYNSETEDLREYILVEEFQKKEHGEPVYVQRFCDSQKSEEITNAISQEMELEQQYFKKIEGEVDEKITQYGGTPEPREIRDFSTVKNIAFTGLNNGDYLISYGLDQHSGIILIKKLLGDNEKKAKINNEKVQWNNEYKQYYVVVDFDFVFRDKN